jgi:hypothetical protein
MRMILLALLFVVPNAQASKDYSGLLSSSTSHVCALARDEVHCFWNDSFGYDVTDLSRYQILKNPRKVITHDSDICAIDDDGLKCWGGHFAHTDNSKIPKLINPRSFSGFAMKEACALDDTGIVCWTEYGQIVKPPELKNPKAVVATMTRLCALDEVGVQCWGKDPQVQIPPLENPRELAASDNNVCVLDDDGIHCFDHLGIQKPILGVNNPHMLAAGDDHVCAVTDDGVRCWEFKGARTSDAVPMEVPPLKNIRALVAGRWHTCALDDDGVHCWGKMGSNQDLQEAHAPALQFWPTVADPGFYPDEVSEFLDVVATVSSSARGTLFSNLGAFAESNINAIKVISQPDVDAANFLLVALVAPAIQMGDSDYFVKTLIPAYNLSLLKFSQKTGVSNIADIPATDLNKRIAIKIIQESLAPMKDFVSSQDQIEIQKLIQLIGKATANPTRHAVQDVLSKLKTQDGIFTKLNTSSKTAFLTSTLKSSAAWLESKQ